MAKSSGQKFFIENILGLKDEEPVTPSPSLRKGQKRRRQSDDSAGTTDQSFHFRLTYPRVYLIFR